MNGTKSETYGEAFEKAKELLNEFQSLHAPNNNDENNLVYGMFSIIRAYYESNGL